jgi:molybdenum cofactor biosynthesis protein B
MEKKKVAHHDHLKNVPKIIKIGIVIVSSSRYNEFKEDKPSTDRSLPIIRNLLSGYKSEKANTTFKIEFEKIVADDAEQIKEIIQNFTQNDDLNINALIFSGGTGITRRDITIETISALFKKELPGFGELFRSLSFQQIGTSTILSRATAGIIKNTAIFLIPGSPKAVKLALEKIIVPELPHIISELYREKLK